MRQGNEQFGKCLLINTLYKSARQYNETIAAKTIPGIRNRLQECEQNFQVQYDNPRLIRPITEVTEIGSTREAT